MISWRVIQKKSFTDWKKLVEYLELDPDTVLPNPKFPLNLPFRLAQKIHKGDRNDPILRQFLPTEKELTITPGFVSDPVGDRASRKGKKLLHKYKGRALLVTTGACAMNCRFCFRKNFDYEVASFDEELEVIAADDSIEEIILSGGDPLSHSDQTLKKLISSLDKIPHLKRLRFHTRFPVGIPERIDASFIKLLKSTRLQVFFILHSNHPRELDTDVRKAIKKIQLLGIPVLSHTVLLKGVNDDFATLKALFSKFIEYSILPYYLNQLDKVQGAAHFEVEEKRGISLMKELAKELPGYALPRYVKEVAGEPNKIGIL